MKKNKKGNVILSDPKGPLCGAKDLRVDSPPQGPLSWSAVGLRMTILLGFLLSFFAAVSILGNWLVFNRIESRLDLKIKGQFSPVLFAPAFYLKNTSFEWNGKVRFENGDLKVEYQPLSFLNSKGLHIHLSGKNLQVHLLGDWAQMQGVEKADLQKFDADFSLGRKGLNEIYWMHVDSHAFQFHLEKSENSSTTRS